MVGVGGWGGGGCLAHYTNLISPRCSILRVAYWAELDGEVSQFHRRPKKKVPEDFKEQEPYSSLFLTMIQLY